MPSSDQHETQFKSNIETLHYLSNATSPSYDWMITIYFYAAMHLIEKKLAEYNKHSENHGERNLSVRTLFRKIKVSYDTLYIESQNARYNCIDMTEGKLRIAETHFKIIEKELA